MQEELIIGTAGTITSAVGTATQTNDVLRTISLVITILGAIITYIGIPLYNWWKKAKEDKKITKDELEEGIKIVKDGSEKVKDAVDKTKE